MKAKQETVKYKESHMVGRQQLPRMEDNNYNKFTSLIKTFKLEAEHHASPRPSHVDVFAESRRSISDMVAVFVVMNNTSVKPVDRRVAEVPPSSVPSTSRPTACCRQEASAAEQSREKA